MLGTEYFMISRNKINFFTDKFSSEIEKTKLFRINYFAQNNLCSNNN